jgi:NADPH2:quinone reductase
MKSIRVHAFGDPSVLQLQDVPDPVPAAGQVVVKLHAVGVNPVETYVRKGIYGPKPFPYTPGSDGAGVVDAVGPGVAKWKVGDRVYVAGAVDGTYAERALCPADRVHPLPAGMSFEQGAAVGVPYATAYRALVRRGRVAAGETLLVHGATGGVGLAAVQIARALGLTVLGTGGTDRGRDVARREGAHHVLDHTKAGYEQDVLAHTGGRGVDVILEMLANVNLAKDLTLLARDGRVVVVGSRGKVEIDPRETMKRDADVRGMTLMNAGDAELVGIHAALVAGLENGTLRPVVGRSFPLADAAAAHEAVMAAGALGKIVLKP